MRASCCRDHKSKTALRKIRGLEGQQWQRSSVWTTYWRELLREGSVNVLCMYVCVMARNTSATSHSGAANLKFLYVLVEVARETQDVWGEAAG